MAEHAAIRNAAQSERLQQGRVHNHLRTLWGKRGLEWSPDSETALRWMIRWNDRCALDRRDPDSYAGIGWGRGRFDRPWGPECAVFWTVRYAPSENTRRRLRLGKYLRIFGPQDMGWTGPPFGDER